MDGKTFVANWDALKGELLASFTAQDSTSAVAAKVRAMGLSDAQTDQMRDVIDGVLKDTMFSLLLGLEGAASIGDEQQQFSISDEDGNVIEGIEDAAWVCFANAQSDLCD